MPPTFVTLVTCDGTFPSENEFREQADRSAVGKLSSVLDQLRLAHRTNHSLYVTYFYDY